MSILIPSQDTLFVGKLTESSFTTVEPNSIVLSTDVSALAIEYKEGKGYYSCLNKNFDFWNLVYYAIESYDLSDYLDNMVDQIGLDDGYTGGDNSLLIISVEYFFHHLRDAFIKPGLSLANSDTDDGYKIKILGRDGYILWINAY